MIPDSLRRDLADRYDLLRELGAGGMAVVYLAHDRRHDRQVALKLLHAELSEVLGAERFRREIELTARLQHPHILPLHDSGSAAGRLFYVMPFIEGESLRARLTRERTLPVADALALAREVGDALAYAHELGVVHRDLKPENILLSRGHALLADFGIARVERGASDRLTGTGMSLGTPAYMSPEQAVGEASIAGRSDQYGMACVLYELLAGAPPFEGPNGAAIITQHLTAAVPSVTARRPEVSGEVAAALTRALAKQPSDRFASIRAFVDALHVAPERTPDPHSIAVLPFANLSPDPDTDYFADGLTDEIITDLSRIRALRVISRNSAMQYKGTSKDTRTIGRELHVRYLLEGGVRRAGNALRVTAQLIEAAEDRSAWAERFTGTLEDVFEIQEQIARKISGALEVRLTTQEDRRLGQHGIVGINAYQRYLKARQLAQTFVSANLEIAETLLVEALNLEPTAAPLLATLGYVRSAFIQIGARGYERLSDATQLIDAALQRDPDLGLALVARATCALREVPLDLGNVLRPLRRAFDVERNAEAAFWLASQLTKAGRVDLATFYARHLTLLDPGNDLNAFFEPYLQILAGRIDVLDRFERATQAVPPGNILRLHLATCAAALGDWDRALRTAIAEQDSPDATGECARLFVASLRGDATATREAASSEWLKSARAHDEDAGLWSAQCLAHVGLLDEALECLRQAMERGFLNAHFVGTIDQMLAPLHAHPEFPALLTEMDRRSRDVIARAGFAEPA